MAYTKYSLTPANNNAAPPDGAPEGMLPSAVNDTMRDMMAQIRDVGDGIRGGTYTMTAPVITGGSITGVALSGNTFTNPVITGGSINNTPIGATTASTGRFSTITGTGLTSGRVTYATTNGQLTDDADFTFNGTTVTMANDASISGLTVGKGGGSQTSNTAIGVSALAVNSTGQSLVAVGKDTLLNNTASNNTAVGTSSLAANTSGAQNSSFGTVALNLNTTGSNNSAFGVQALYSNTTASNNTAVGYQAGYSTTIANGNTFIGYKAGYSTNYTAGSSTTVNTFIGYQAGNLVTTGYNNTILGGYSGNQGGLDIRTANNYIVLADGDGNVEFTAKDGSSWALPGATVKTGTGITFPATQSASSDANTLDDYEEGTFTPSVVGQSTAGTFTYSTREGKYTKVGNVVNVQIAIYVSATSVSASGVAAITGLPFTISNANNTFSSFNIGWLGNITFSGFVTAYGDGNTTQLILRESTSASFGGIIGGAQLASQFYIFVSGTYMAST